MHALAARVHAAKGEKEQCRKELTATLDCASESTSDEAQFESLFDAGMILHDIGDWERCAPLLSTAAEAAEKLGKIAHAARAYNRSGSALFRSGRPDYAARCWIRELKTLESDESSAPGVLAQAHGNVASALLLAGGDAEAFNLHRESARQARARRAPTTRRACTYSSVTPINSPATPSTTASSARRSVSKKQNRSPPSTSWATSRLELWRRCVCEGRNERGW